MPTLRHAVARHSSLTKEQQDYLQHEYPPTTLRLVGILANGVLAEWVEGFHHFEDDEYSPSQAADILCKSAFDSRWYTSEELKQMHRAVGLAKLKEKPNTCLLNILVRTEAQTRHRRTEQAKAVIQNYHVLEQKLAS